LGEWDFSERRAECGAVSLPLFLLAVAHANFETICVMSENSRNSESKLGEPVPARTAGWLYLISIALAIISLLLMKWFWQRLIN
jgi:hypothetical protein